MDEDFDRISKILKRTDDRQQKMTELSKYLHELESHLSLVFAYSPDLIVLSDTDGKILRINHTVRKVLGYEPKDVIGKTIWDFIHPDEIQPTRELRETYLKQNTFFTPDKDFRYFTNRWRRVDGSYAKLVWKFAFYDADNGWMIKFAVDFTNIALENPFQTNLIVNCIQNTTAGVVITDYTAADNPIIFANKAFERMSGYLLNELVGVNCRMLNMYDRDQAALKTIREAIANEKGCEVLMKNFRPNGDEWYNLLLAEPVKIDGITTNYIGSSRDVTEQIKAGYLIWDKDAERGFGIHR